MQKVQNILVLKESQLPVKSLHRAKVILSEAKRQKAVITFEVEGHTFYIEPEDNNEFTFFDRDNNSSVKLSEEEAIYKFYEYRKHFNSKWNNIRKLNKEHKDQDVLHEYADC